MTTATTYTVPVPEDKAGTRLDRLLADAVPTMSRTRLQALIGEGCVKRGDLTAEDPSAKVRAGETYVVLVPPARPALPPPQEIPLQVIFEDEHLIVVNKPAGLVVHPAPGHGDGTLVNALLHHCGGSLSGIGGVTRPGIVHRLDKETSGLMVAAKTDTAHRHLSQQFADHTIERVYKAVVWGRPHPAEGEVEGNIGRNPRNRKKMAVVSRGGKPALTRYKVLRTVGTVASLVECRLATGRTHQIRVHMANLGHAVIGDPVYGGGWSRRQIAQASDRRQGAETYKSQALHAGTLGFVHPITEEDLSFNSNIPTYIMELLGFLDEI